MNYKYYLFKNGLEDSFENFRNYKLEQKPYCDMPSAMFEQSVKVLFKYRFTQYGD